MLVRERVRFRLPKDPCYEQGPINVVIGYPCEDCAGISPQKSFCIRTKGHEGEHFYVTALDKRVVGERAF